ncbi:MAG TPA: hydantoinase/oxoprolinase family protein [Gammaproteobacteria bacterium]|nr:hydantoinase/oxoprolinase family protein [Gammaproteobacteria bacterium]
MRLLGIDTGGTFTDFVYYDGVRLRIHKVLSTPSDPAAAILRGINELALDAAQLHIVHGSTVATNALLENKLARTAYIANYGLKDVLTIGRQARPELYNLTPHPVLPPVPPELCFEVEARLSASGKELSPLSAQVLQRLCDQLVASGSEAVAVNLLFSFLDPRHEREIAQALPKHLFVACSSEVLPEAREYERGIATWLNAGLSPVMQRYLGRLQRELKSASLAVMQSSGGTLSAAQAERSAVRLLLSGPAGGLAAAKAVAEMAGYHKLLTFDMGGTSTDVALVDGEIRLTSEGRIGRYPVSVPMIDMHTIGAGGGSISCLDAGGMLRVGPESAGALPGPACYGRGGALPTVTDANVVLGRLPAMLRLGGHLELNAQSAHDAFRALAHGMGLSVQEAAAGVLRLVNEHMVQALRLISVRRGISIKDFTLLSFGGAGGLHVCALADALDLRRALVPLHAGVLSALGMLLAPRQRLLSHALQRRLSEVPEIEVTNLLEELRQTGLRELLAEGVPANCTETFYTVDLRYEGQSYTLEVPWQGGIASARVFHEKHEQEFGHRMELPVELVNVRSLLRAPPPPVEMPRWRSSADRAGECQQTQVYGYDTSIPVRFRDSLRIGETLCGPALICDAVATTFIDRGWEGEIDRFGNLVLGKQ